nr:hypothetical protein [bacterium]
MTGPPRQRGSITLWLLGLGMCLLVMGGMGLDLWSVVAMRARLVEVAEAIATAAASGISETHWRDTGEIRLDPARVRQLGRDMASTDAVVGLLEGPPEITVDPEFRSVTVQVSGSVSLTLLSLGVESGRVDITASATSRPHVGG